MIMKAEECGAKDPQVKQDPSSFFWGGQEEAEESRRGERANLLANQRSCSWTPSHTTITVVLAALSYLDLSTSTQTRTKAGREAGGLYDPIRRRREKDKCGVREGAQLKQSCPAQFVYNINKGKMPKQQPSTLALSPLWGAFSDPSCLFHLS